MTQVLANMDGQAWSFLVLYKVLCWRWIWVVPLTKQRTPLPSQRLPRITGAPMAANFIASLLARQWVLPSQMSLAKRKFTDVERKGIGGCFIGGCVMITEFAIPDVAADPLHVISSLWSVALLARRSPMFLG